jgi:TolB protein
VLRTLCAALLCLAGLLVCVASAPGRARPHPYDYSPAWSPDGRHIAFLRDEAVHVMNADGTGVHSLPGAGSFSWSPRGRLAFPRTRGESAHLYSSRANGTDLRQITFGRVQDFHPAWSPDGRSLLFVRIGAGDRTDIWRVDADGSGLQRLTSDGHSFLGYLDRVWSPDGRRFVFVSCAGRKCRKHRNDIFVMSSSGGRRRRLTWSNDNNTPTWSPDGGLISYFTATDTDLEHTSSAEIYTIRPDGTGRRSVTRSRSHDLQLSGNGTSMSWSPGGRWIVFDADSNGVLEGESELWIVGRDGLRAHTWLRGSQRARAADHVPAWSPDGRRIAFVRLYADREPNDLLFGSIHVGRPDGTHLMRLTY